MNLNDVHAWMARNNVSATKLAKYLGRSVPHFINVLNGRQPLSKQMKNKLQDVMTDPDTLENIHTNAYLRVGFTREEWDRIKRYYTEEELRTYMRVRILSTVDQMDLLRTGV